MLYLTITQPDISYSVQTLGQLMDKPRQPHLDAFHRVLRYIKTSPAQGLMFPVNSDLQLKAFCDSDWASVFITAGFSTRPTADWIAAIMNHVFALQLAVPREEACRFQIFAALTWGFYLVVQQEIDS